MITMTINGRLVCAKKEEMLLTVLRQQKIDIPALCHHEAVEPYGACRLCMVEITRKEWDGGKNMVASCLYPAEDGLIIQTHTADLIEFRKTILDLYLARCPNAQEIQELAAQYGITKTSYEQVASPNDCILCGLCTRICDRMGFGAISAVSRGHGREITPPMKDAPPDCVGCLACALNCPTHHIKYSDCGFTREIWGRKFELLRDTKTGQPTITREYAEYLSKNCDIPQDYFELDDYSHRKKTAFTLGKIAIWNREVTE